MAYQLCPLWGKQKRLCPSSSSSWLLMPKSSGSWFTKGQNFILINGKDNWFCFFFFEFYWWFVTSTSASAAFISAMCNVSFTTIFYTLYGIFSFFFLMQYKILKVLWRRRRGQILCVHAWVWSVYTVNHTYIPAGDSSVVCRYPRRVGDKTHTHTHRHPRSQAAASTKPGRRWTGNLIPPPEPCGGGEWVWERGFHKVCPAGRP